MGPEDQRRLGLVGYLDGRLLDPNRQDRRMTPQAYEFLDEAGLWEVAEQRRKRVEDRGAVELRVEHNQISSGHRTPVGERQRPVPDNSLL